MVLKSNQARGRWGEETLRRVVEAAGMSAHCDFSEQTQAGENKPDLIVRLPGDRFIIVDAKVPDFDFLNALDTADAGEARGGAGRARRKIESDNQGAGRPRLSEPIPERAGLRGAVLAGGIIVQRRAGRRSRFDRLGGGASGFCWRRRRRSSRCCAP